MSYYSKDDVAYINDKPATKCQNEKCFHTLFDNLSDNLCPECDAHLAIESGICLNACHLNGAQYRRLFQGLKYQGTLDGTNKP